MTKKGRIIAFLLVVVISFGLIGATGMDVASGITLGLDLQGGFEILYQVVPREGQVVTNELLIHTQAALGRRVDTIGVTEPDLKIEGDDRIRVKLAGVTDQEQARRMLSTEAHLTFRDTNDTLMMSGDNLKEGTSRVVFNDMNQPIVEIKFKDAALARDVTSQLIRKPMVIWLDYEEGDSYQEEFQKWAVGEDPKYISAPQVNAVLSDGGIIEGDFSYEEATELSNLLNAGALPVELEELSANSVGAKLGEHAMTLTVNAGMIGGILILLYMIAYYRLPGVIAAITLLIYVYLILVVFNWMNATLTLPGIAALVLGVGMAVDANIITYERIKEEIRSGKTILSSFKAGSKRSLSTIMDANITTIIAAIVLFYFGESSIQGFAVMLIVSITLSVLTAVVGARILLGLLVSSRAFDRKPGLFGVKEGEISEL